MDNKGNELAKLFNKYVAIALQYIVTKDKKYLDELDAMHNKVKEFISDKYVM
jgi:hypothetical protein